MCGKGGARPPCGAAGGRHSRPTPPARPARPLTPTTMGATAYRADGATGASCCGLGGGRARGGAARRVQPAAASARERRGSVRGEGCGGRRVVAGRRGGVVGRRGGAPRATRAPARPSRSQVSAEARPAPPRPPTAPKPDLSPADAAARASLAASVSRCFLFAGADPAALGAVLAAAVRRPVATGEVVVR